MIRQRDENIGCSLALCTTEILESAIYHPRFIEEHLVGWTRVSIESVMRERELTKIRVWILSRIWVHYRQILTKEIKVGNTSEFWWCKLVSINLKANGCKDFETWSSNIGSAFWSRRIVPSDVLSLCHSWFIVVSCLEWVNNFGIGTVWFVDVQLIQFNVRFRNTLRSLMQTCLNRMKAWPAVNDWWAGIDQLNWKSPIWDVA